jgi:hypothetical protein
VVDRCRAPRAGACWRAQPIREAVAGSRAGLLAAPAREVLMYNVFYITGVVIVVLANLAFISRYL